MLMRSDIFELRDEFTRQGYAVKVADARLGIEVDGVVFLSSTFENADEARAAILARVVSEAAEAARLQAYYDEFMQNYSQDRSVVGKRDVDTRARTWALNRAQGRSVAHMLASFREDIKTDSAPQSNWGSHR